LLFFWAGPFCGKVSEKQQRGMEASFERLLAGVADGEAG